MSERERSPLAAETPRFSADEYRRRAQAVQEVMEAQGLAALVVYGRRGAGHDVNYLSNWMPTREAFLVWPSAEDPTLFVQLFNHVETARDVSVIDDVRFGGATDRGAVDTCGSVAQQLTSLGHDGERIGLVGPITLKHYERLRSLLPAAAFIDVDTPMRRIRSLKSEEEFERIQAAAALSDAAVRCMAEELAPGMREVDIAALVDAVHLDGGGVTTVRHMLSTPMHAPVRGVPAQYPTRRPVEVGDVVVAEISAAIWGYSGQTIRTFTIGQPPTEAYEEMHDLAVAVYDEIVDVLRPGARTEDVHAAADAIHAAGYTILDDLLHGANQAAPIIRTQQASHGAPLGFRFERDMAVVVQPNVATMDGRAGVQYGDMFRIGEECATNLHSAPGGLIECGS